MARMYLTKEGLPNTCAGCGRPCDDEWWAENPEQASAGQGFCENCAFPPGEEEDLTALAKLGQRLTTALYKGGYQAAAQVREAPDEALLAVRGVGPATVQKIRECLGQDQGEPDDVDV